MGDGLVFTLTLVAVLGSALVAGVFLAFSAFVMRALAAVPAEQGIGAMQAINLAAVRPPFMLVFAGTAVVCLPLLVTGVLRWSEPGAATLLAGAVAYLAGTFGLTAGVHVPANNALARLDPRAEGSSTRWAGYVRRWSRWNHVRTAMGLAASACFVTTLLRAV